MSLANASGEKAKVGAKPFLSQRAAPPSTPPTAAARPAVHDSCLLAAGLAAEKPNGFVLVGSKHATCWW